MNKLRQKKQQILRFLFGSFSLTALMFTFQACYGPPQRDYPEEVGVDEAELVSEQDSLSAENAVQAEDGVYSMEEDGESQES